MSAAPRAKPVAQVAPVVIWSTDPTLRGRLQRLLGATSIVEAEPEALVRDGATLAFVDVTSIERMRRWRRHIGFAVACPRHTGFAIIQPLCVPSARDQSK